jgi:hypothetical protein
MRIKTFENFNPNGTVIVFSKINFEITYEDLSDILLEITDDFPEIEWMIESSHYSKTIEICKNSFIVRLCSKQINDEWGFGNTSIAYIEPKIYKIIENINSQLKAYDLYISNNDFPKYVEDEYELIISKIGTKPVERKSYY